MTTITAFGDSVLKGVILENNKYKVSKNKFTDICEEILGIQIENKGKFGSTISTGEKIVEKNLEIIKDSNSKYVALEFGGNDCDYNWKEISENPRLDYKPNSEINDFRILYTELINEIKKLRKIPVLLSLPPIDSKKYLKQISKNLNLDNIIEWLNGDMQFFTNWHERYNIEVFKLAIYNNIPIIDITSKFLEQRNYTKYLCEDGSILMKKVTKLLQKQ